MLQAVLHNLLMSPLSHSSNTCIAAPALGLSKRLDARSYALYP